MIRRSDVTSGETTCGRGACAEAMDTCAAAVRRATVTIDFVITSPGSEDSGFVLVEREDLARVHPVVGVERALDRLHDADGIAVLGLHVLDLAESDTVLARARAAECQGAGDEL